MHVGVAALVGFYLLFPALVIFLCHRFPLLDKIGAVIICYLAGMIVGNVLDLGAASGVQDLLSGGLVAVALPLLLFSIDLRGWSRFAGKATLSMLLATVSIVVVALGAFLLWREAMPHAWQLSGMAVGLYTGGTPNLAAIRTALGVDPGVYITMHTYDAVIGLLYILFVSSVAQRLFSWVLPRFRGAAGDATAEAAAAREAARRGDAPAAAAGGAATEADGMGTYVGMLERYTLGPLLAACGVALLIVGASVGLAEFVPNDYSDAVTILAITTLGLACSFIARIRQIRHTFQAGMYFIYGFCLVVGSMADLRQLFTQVHWDLLGFVTLCVFGSLLLHVLLSRLFKIDVDTTIIVSVSAICSPPFVPVVAHALRNREVILSGIYTGIIGYAIGNYLGISLAYGLRALF